MLSVSTAVLKRDCIHHARLSFGFPMNQPRDKACGLKGAVTSPITL